jgi:hypothetical protein
MADYGTLYDYDSGSAIGPATEDQMRRSLNAARIDGGRGVIQGAGRKGWRIRDNGASVIEYGDTAPTGPAHDADSDSPCDCFDCNGTEVDGPYLFEHLCYVGDVPAEIEATA